MRYRRHAITIRLDDQTLALVDQTVRQLRQERASRPGLRPALAPNRSAVIRTAIRDQLGRDLINQPTTAGA